MRNIRAGFWNKMSYSNFDNIMHDVGNNTSAKIGDNITIGIWINISNKINNNISDIISFRTWDNVYTNPPVSLKTKQTITKQIKQQVK